MNPRRLTRSRDRQLAGVAGGMAEYLDIDPTVVRILWIIVGIASGGLAILGYIILALVMPQAVYAPAPGAWATAGAPGAATGPAGGWGTPPGAPAWGTAPDSAGYAANAGWAAQPPQAASRPEGRGIGAAAIFGVILVVIGGIALANAALPGWAANAILGPAVILALGAALLVSSLRRHPADAVAGAASAGTTPTPAAPSAAPVVAPAQYATPAAGMEFPAGPWETTDTQPVGPEVFAPETPSQADATPDEGTHPA